MHQAVQVWRFDNRMPQSRNCIKCLIIGKDKKEIGLDIFFSLRPCLAYCRQKKLAELSVTGIGNYRKFSF